MTSQIAVLFDYENVRRLGESAFDCYGRGANSPSPIALAEAIAAKRSEPSIVGKIVVVRGRPNPAYQRSESCRFDKDRASWLSDSRVVMHSIDLHYDRSHLACKEAGVDVRFALEMVRLASIGKFDALVAFSGDLDLKPAIEDALRIGARVELAQWAGYGNSTVLGEWFKRQKRHWIHAMTADDYWDSVPGRCVA